IGWFRERYQMRNSVRLCCHCIRIIRSSWKSDSRKWESPLLHAHRILRMYVAPDVGFLESDLRIVAALTLTFESHGLMLHRGPGTLVGAGDRCGVIQNGCVANSAGETGRRCLVFVQPRYSCAFKRSYPMPNVLGY